jgi:hypothetical protein
MDIKIDRFGAKTITETVNGEVFKITYHFHSEADAIASFKESVKNIIESRLKRSNKLG